MNLCNSYDKWKYDFSHSKSAIVTSGKPEPYQFESWKDHEWLSCDTKVEELYKYKNKCKNFTDMRISVF